MARIDESMVRLLNAMDEETLRELNTLVVRILNRKRGDREAEAAKELGIGSKAVFKSRSGSLVSIIVDKINQKSVSGRELDAQNNPTFRRWKVSPSLLTPL